MQKFNVRTKKTEVIIHINLKHYEHFTQLEKRTF